jgi:uncharacterized protein YkwD
MKIGIFHLFLTKVIFSLTFLSCSQAQNAERGRVKSKSIEAASLFKNVPLTGNFKTDMLVLVNSLRTKGCTCNGKHMPPVLPLSWNSLLEESATKHAGDMNRNQFFEHEGSDGSEIDDRIARTGYKWRYVGENIAFGQRSILDAMYDWVKSPSHCRQLMSNLSTEMGAARIGIYWVQNFAAPSRY